jgi:hypothetical protein
MAMRCRGLVSGKQKRASVNNDLSETLPFDTTRACAVRSMAAKTRKVHPAT